MAKFGFEDSSTTKLNPIYEKLNRDSRDTFYFRNATSTRAISSGEFCASYFLLFIPRSFIPDNKSRTFCIVKNRYIINYLLKAFF